MRVTAKVLGLQTFTPISNGAVPTPFTNSASVSWTVRSTGRRKRRKRTRRQRRRWCPEKNSRPVGAAHARSGGVAPLGGGGQHQFVKERTVVNHGCAQILRGRHLAGTKPGFDRMRG